MRDHTRLGTWAVAAIVAVGAAGCGGSTGRSPQARPSTVPRPVPAFTAAMAPGFASQPAWSQDVPWNMGFTSGGATIAPDLGLMVMQAEAGFIQVVGASLAVVSFTGAPGGGDHSTSVQFRSLATGALLSTVDLPAKGSFDGLYADAVGGRAVAVVHHGASAPAAQGGGTASIKVTSVYGADGSLVWTSQGRAIASGAADSSGLMTFPNGFPIYSGGYTVRHNGSPDPNGGSYDVLDPAGTVALHIPGTAGADGKQPHISLAGGYALVSSISQHQAADGSASSVSLSAYDLGHGAAKVGQWTEPAATAPGGQGELLAATGGRLQVTWPAPGTGSKVVTGMAVLDAATGTASTVSGIPSDASDPAALGAVWDSSTGSLTVYEADTTKTGPAFGINLASGTVAWSKPSSQAMLEPVSTYGGAVYAVQLGTASASASMVTIRESDGAVTAHGYQIAPVAFTDHGAAVFAQSTSPTTLTTARIGVSATSGVGS